MAQAPGSFGMWPADDEHISPGALSYIKKRILYRSGNDVNYCLAADGFLKLTEAVARFLRLIALRLRGGAAIVKDMNQ